MTDDNKVYQGILRATDQNTNCVLSPCIEKRQEDGNIIQKNYETFFIRGNHVIIISPNPLSLSRESE